MPSPDRVSLNSLPYDLLLNIAIHLDTHDVHALHLTCRSLYDFSSTRPVYRQLAHNLLRRCRPLPLKGFQRLADLTTEQLVRAVNKAAHFDYAWRIRPPRPIAIDLTGLTPPRSNYMDITPGSSLAKRQQEEVPKWYKVVSAPPGEAVDWLSPITSSYTLCATKSGKVVCWDVQSDQCLAEWNPGPQWELWKCRVEFEERTIYFTMAKVLSGSLDDDRVMHFVLMKLTFFDAPSGESSNKPPIFSKVAEFRTRGVVMNVFLLDPTKRLLSAFTWVSATGAIGLYVIPDWHKDEYIFIDTGIECAVSSNWSCILYQQNIVIHCEETNAAFQHFYPLSLLRTAATGIRLDRETPMISCVMPPARTLSKKFIFPSLSSAAERSDGFTGNVIDADDDSDTSGHLPAFYLYNETFLDEDGLFSEFPTNHTMSSSSASSPSTTHTSGSTSATSTSSDLPSPSSLRPSWTVVSPAPYQPHPLAMNSTVFPPSSSPPPSSESSTHSLATSSSVSESNTAEDPLLPPAPQTSSAPVYSVTHTNPFPFPKWMPESAHFVRQWWPSLPSIPRVSCTVVLLSRQEPGSERTRFVLAQHYFRVPLDMHEWDEGFLDAVGISLNRDTAADKDEKRTAATERENGLEGTAHRWTTDGHNRPTTSRSPPSASAGPGSGPSLHTGTESWSDGPMPSAGSNTKAEPHPAEDNINEDALMKLWYVSQPFEVVRIYDDNPYGPAWTEDAEDEAEDPKSDDEYYETPNYGSADPSTSALDNDGSLPASQLASSSGTASTPPPPQPDVVLIDDDDEGAHNRPRPLVAVDFGHAVWVEYVNKSESHQLHRSHRRSERDDKCLRFVTFPPFGDDYGDCVEAWGRAQRAEQNDEGDEEVVERSIWGLGSRLDREMARGRHDTAKGKAKAKGKNAGTSTGHRPLRCPAASEFRPGEVRTIPHPPELDLGRVETINIDQSQGAVILSDKDGRIFILCYE